MKKPTTMRRAVLWSTLIVTGLVLATYTLLLERYFAQGLSAAIEIDLLHALKENERLLQETPPTTAAVDIAAQSISIYGELPDRLKTLFAEQQLTDEKVAYVEEQTGADKYPTTYLVMPYRLPTGQRVYATQSFTENAYLQHKWSGFETLLLLTIPLGGCFLLLILFVVVRLGRRLSRPADRLARWADQLTLDNHQQVRPDFAFQELNLVADRLQDAFRRIGAFLERERDFLRHASHELRTPVAVVKANVELMQKYETDPRTDLPVQRIGRAAQNMQQLIEALLWISREEGKEIPCEEVELCALLNDCAEELSYLLSNKPVSYSLQCVDNPVILNLPKAPFRILCNNLLHNAFQHTTEGTISIRLTSRELEVRNQDVAPIQGETVEESFGIGLELVRLLAKKLAWEVRLCPEVSGYRAILLFPEQTEDD